MKKLANLSDLQFRLLIIAVTLVLAAAIGIFTSNPTVRFGPGYFEPASLVIFLGAYLATIGPDLRKTNLSAMAMPEMPSVQTVRAGIEVARSTTKPMTNTRRKELARRAKKGHK